MGEISDMEVSKDIRYKNMQKIGIGQVEKKIH